MVEINGIKVELFESMYVYVSEGSLSAYNSERGEVGEPAAKVVEIAMTDDSDFTIGDFGDSFPETIEVDGVEYTRVNWKEEEISYLKTEALDDLLFVVLERDDKQGADGYYEYPYLYPDNSPIYELRHEAEMDACVRSIRGWKANDGIDVLADQFRKLDELVREHQEDFEGIIQAPKNAIEYLDEISSLAVAKKYRDAVDNVNGAGMPDGGRKVWACDTKGQYLFTDDDEEGLKVGYFEDEYDEYCLHKEEN